MATNGHILHSQSEQARETGEFVKALALSDQAILAYQQEGNTIGFTEVLASRFLTFRHLFEQTQDQNFLILAKSSANSAVEIAKNSHDPQALAVPAL